MLQGTLPYLRIEEDGTLANSSKEPDTEDFQQIEDGTLTILRYRIYTPEAAAVAGAPGVWETLMVESSTKDEPEEEDGVETEPEVEWQTSWEPIG